MRIVAVLVCTLLFSVALPSRSFAGACDDLDNLRDVRNCLDREEYENKGKGNCNENGNCNKSKDKGNSGKGNSKNKSNDNDYSVSCSSINDRDARRECMERR